MSRYQRITTEIWRDERFSKLTDNARLLYFYILTCPHGNPVGLFVLRPGYAACDMRWEPKRFKESFAELLAQGLIEWDENAETVLLPRHLKHNPIFNENQAKHAAMCVKGMPRTLLAQKVLTQLTAPHHSIIAETVMETIAETVTGTVPETPNPNPLPIPVPKKRKAATSAPPTIADLVAEFTASGAYPGIDIEQEAKKAALWLQGPKGRGRRFTWKFFFNWLGRADATIGDGRECGAEGNGRLPFPDYDVWYEKNKHRKTSSDVSLSELYLREKADYERQQ